jgi:drug/metabolite transporter (DMT)-like permease
LGYLFALLAMVSFGMLGILSKLSDRHKCPALGTTLCIFAGATVMMGFAVIVFRDADFRPPAQVIGVAVVFGIITVLSSWVFLYGIKFGKITTSWVIINLSAAVPTIASIVIYGEPVGVRKILLLLLVGGSILLMWKDMKDEGARAQAGASQVANTVADPRKPEVS